uniref:HNH endonuclease n=1 Tax=Cohnella sp. REN36 TaxID=2887347 RepID=UPI001D14FF16
RAPMRAPDRAAAPAPAPARASKRGAPRQPDRTQAGLQAAQSPSHAVARHIDPHDFGALRPTREGFIRMRGRTDKGRQWYQEIDLEMAVTLVRERAAIVVNRHTIRRLYSNKDFRSMILTRDRYTCYFCGEYGDTIDHLLPRSKGGHTTPDNCVCACHLCNQTKANRDLDEFMSAGIPERVPTTSIQEG